MRIFITWFLCFQEKKKILNQEVSQHLKFSWNRNPSKFCFGNPNMMFPKQNMLSQYPQQLPTEINAIPVISQVSFPWLAVVTKATKSGLGSSLAPARASAETWPQHGDLSPLQELCRDARAQRSRGSWPDRFRNLDACCRKQADVLVKCSPDPPALQKCIWVKHLRGQGEISRLLFCVFSVVGMIGQED